MSLPGKRTSTRAQPGTGNQPRDVIDISSDSEDEHAKAFEMLELKRHLDAIHQVLCQLRACLHF